jgi:hypothetical protein
MGKSWKDKRDKWERSDKNKRKLSSKPFKGGKKNRDKQFNSYEEDDTSSSF